MKRIDFLLVNNDLIKVRPQKRLTGFLSAALSFVVISILLVTGIVFAQPPLPTKPASEAAGVNPSNVEFSWSASDPLSDTYIIDISKKSDMSTIAVTKTVSGGILGFTYNGTLEDNTAYYWRVSGGGQTSPVLKFTTKSATSTTTPPNEKSFIDGIIETLGWPVIIGIFCVLFVLIVLVLAFRKPRVKSQDQIQGQNQSRRPPPVQNQCPSCGFLNPSNRQSCISCGGILPLSIGINQMGQMGGQQSMRAPGSPMGQTGGGMGAVNPPYQMGTRPTNFQNPMGGIGQANAQYQMGQMGNMGGGMQQQQQPWQAPQAQQNTACPSCGTPTNPGKQFCGNCGASLISPQLQQQAPQFQNQQQTQQNVICPTCGSPNPSGRPFCGNCGGSLAGSHQKQIVQTTQSFACPVCGNQINAGMNPCPSCNTWLEWGP